MTTTKIPGDRPEDVELRSGSDAVAYAVVMALNEAQNSGVLSREEKLAISKRADDIYALLLEGATLEGPLADGKYHVTES